MTFPVEDRQGFSVVLLNGEIDLNNSPDARKVILNNLKKKHHVMVDLSDVAYIDSSGVASLVEGFQYARTNDLEFGLVGVSEAAMSVLRLARLDQVFTIYASLDERLEDGG
ncbi:anti-sigma B factor antagonist [Thiogranum longum]|uniref:Anti-sigma factor antagonist n=1 Tax=Thiogranum longum TaxID=1537524 RepID=A0A4R1HAK2_9GAMM|nr:STAS domain-containing protein [Thiogranum longum]TCK18977.1 anti-sigma B factor antagonist [Thiogranum longum]